MAEEVKVSFVQSEFRFCIVEWETENYGYAAHGMKYDLQSPPFEVQPFTTLWRFVLKSDQGLCDDTEMLFFLERMDSGYETVWVSYDVSVTDQDKKKWKGGRGEHHFKPKDNHFVSVPNIYYEKVNASMYNFNFMTIQCRMIVSYDEKYSFSDLQIDPGLKGLSEDMDKLYMNEKYTDLTIKLGDNAKIGAHKAILSVRNTVLKEKLSQGDPPIIHCSALYYDGMKQVLRYIYTGDLVKAVNYPSVSAHDCINYLSIEELKIHFISSEIKLKSSIDVHQTGLLWRIENFKDINEKCIVSDLISSDKLEMVWKLSLYPKGVDGNGEYLAVIAENVEGKIAGNVWAKVEIYSDPLRRTWKTMEEVKQGEIFEIHNLEDRKSAFEKLEDGTLSIGFKACVSVGVTNLSHYQGMNTTQRTPLEDYYKNLSEDIRQLRKDDKYSDVIIVAQTESFKAHKCILSVRSSKLGNDLGNRGEIKTINVENTKPQVVEIILNYMYSGIFEKSDWSVVLEVYEAAVKFGVNHLQQECSKYLCKNINMDNLVQILTVACEEKDAELESVALKFARVNVLKKR